MANELTEDIVEIQRRKDKNLLNLRREKKVRWFKGQFTLPKEELSMISSRE